MTFSVEGAWSRRSVSVDGGEPFETQRVYWLQSGDCYADLRVPFHPEAETACFAGRSGWDGERYRWAHRLDLARAAGPAGDAAGDDVGELEWDGDRLIERGRLGTVTYEEIWVPLPGGEGESEALESRSGCHVRVGDHAITIVDGRPQGGEFRACYRVRTGGRWAVGAVIGEAAVGVKDLCGVHVQNPSHLAGQAR